jgi:hypothetical protein
MEHAVAGSAEGLKDPEKGARIFETSLSRSRTSRVKARIISTW